MEIHVYQSKHADWSNFGTNWTTYRKRIMEVKGHHIEYFFCGDEGALYFIDSHGKLWFQKHHTWDSPGQEMSPNLKQINIGWDQYRAVFSGSEGALYAIHGEGPRIGQLVQYQHKGWNYSDAQDPNDWGKQAVSIGPDWEQYKTVFAGDDGDICAIGYDGEFYLYRQKDWRDAGGNFPVVRNRIGQGWDMRLTFAGPSRTVYGSPHQSTAGDGGLLEYKYGVDGFMSGPNTVHPNIFVQDEPRTHKIWAGASRSLKAPASNHCVIYHAVRIE